MRLFGITVAAGTALFFANRSTATFTSRTDSKPTLGLGESVNFKKGKSKGGGSNILIKIKPGKKTGVSGNVSKAGKKLKEHRRQTKQGMLCMTEDYENDKKECFCYPEDVPVENPDPACLCDAQDIQEGDSDCIVQTSSAVSLKPNNMLLYFYGYLAKNFLSLIREISPENASLNSGLLLQFVAKTYDDLSLISSSQDLLKNYDENVCKVLSRRNNVPYPIL